MDARVREEEQEEEQEEEEEEEEELEVREERCFPCGMSQAIHKYFSTSVDRGLLRVIINLSIT